LYFSPLPLLPARLLPWLVVLPEQIQNKAPTTAGQGSPVWRFFVAGLKSHGF